MGTWTKDGVLWPKKLLPKKIPSARILTYGYDAKLAYFWSPPAENEIDGFSDDFSSRLENDRSEGGAVRIDRRGR